MFDIYKNYPELATIENTPHEPLYQENFGCPRLLTPMNKKTIPQYLGNVHIDLYVYPIYFQEGYYNVELDGHTDPSKYF